MSAGALAKACGVPRTRIERLVGEQIGITADTALRLSRALGTTPELWMNLQNSFDVKTTMLSISKELDRIEPVNKAA
jgi:addiction module HigA family antidote